MRIHPSPRVTRSVAAAVFSIALVWSSAGFAQADDRTRADWLQANAVPVRSIDPQDESFEDLEPIAKWIGDARIVGLGEQTHGDGATFHAKVRLVKFLHQKMGFDVLVWESGMFDCAEVEAALKKGASIKKAWRKGIFGVWAASEQVRPLLEYIDRTRATDRPLEIAGMDAQVTSTETPDAIRAYIEKLNDDAGSPAALADAFRLLGTWTQKLKWQPLPTMTVANRTALHDALQSVMVSIESSDGPFATLSAPDRSFALRTLRNYRATVDILYWGVRTRGPKPLRGAMQKMANAREPAMAETLTWLAQQRYPKRKLIVWAASSHLAWNPSEVEWPKGDGWKPDATGWEPMGHASKRVLGDAFYTINFIAYEGDIGSVAGWKRPLQKAKPGTLDALCHETGKPYLFVDLRTMPDRPGGAWLRDKLVARPRGYLGMRANWHKVTDAFFFTDKMYPSTRSTDLQAPPKK